MSFYWDDLLEDITRHRKVVPVVGSIARCFDTRNPAERTPARTSMQEAVAILRGLQASVGLQPVHASMLEESERFLTETGGSP